MREFIVIKSERNYKKIFVNEIIYCMADGAYTIFYLNNNERLIFSSLLKVVEELLANNNFFRINRSYLVNLDYCYELIIGKKPALILPNNVKLYVSLSKMKLLRDRFCTHL